MGTSVQHIAPRRFAGIAVLIALLGALLVPITLSSPAQAAPDCDLGGFEIDGNEASDCLPAVDDWATVDETTTSGGGTYTASSKDVDDPSTWALGGSTPDKTNFDTALTFARVGPDGHYYLYVGWYRTSDSGTGKYAIDLNFGATNVAPSGAPQPDHDEGGIVSYINTSGSSAPVLGQLCEYASQADYPDDVDSDPGCTTSTSGFASAVGDVGGQDFFEIGFDLTELAGIEPGCPPAESVATVYLRSITGGGGNGNLKAYVDPLEVSPPSTCGTLEVSKESLGDLDTDSDTDFDYSVDGPTNIDDSLQIGETDTHAEVEPGTYDLTETIPGGAPWTLDSIVCTHAGETFTGEDFPVTTGETTSCVITNATSYVDVSKVVDPAGAEGSFSFDIDGTAVDLSGGETSDPIQFAPGTTVTITETDVDGWGLADITCTSDGDAIDTETDLTAGTATFDTIAGETVSCAYTNETSYVTVTKQTDPDGSDQEFSFDVEGESVSLQDGETSDPIRFAPGTEVTISETDVPAGWELTDITCDDQSTGDASVTVTTVAGETTDCVFTNTQLGTIIVNKVMVGVDDTTFGFDGSWLDPTDFTITTADGVGTETFDDVVPGSYTLTEAAILGYDATNLVCVDPTQDSSVSADLEAAIELAPGETVECTYTNTQRGMVRVDKETLPDEHDTDFDFTFAGGEENASFTLNDASDDEDEPWSSGLIRPDTYTVTETVPADWTLTGADCGTLEGSTAAVELEPGAVVTCTFTNTADPGSLTLTKAVEGVADGYEWSFDFDLVEEPAGDPVTETVSSDDPVASWSDLAVGATYTLVEQAPPAGWTAGDITCTGLDDADPEAAGFQFAVVPGLALECAATNTAAPADVEVTKTVEGVADDYAWSFGITIAPAPADQDATQTASGTGPSSDEVAWTDLVPGETYTLTEDATAPGWQYGDIACNIDDADPETAGFQVVAEVGTSYTCSVTNIPDPGSITVTKTAVGGDGSFSFELQPLDSEGAPDGDPLIDEVTTTDGSGEATFTDLTPGTRYSIAEVDPGEAWIAGDLTCTVTHADQSTGDVAVGDFTVEVGDQVACSITNTAKGTIIVNKVVEGVADATFGYTGSWLDPTDFTISTADGVGSQTFDNVDPGTYDLSEDVFDGYDTTDLVCVDPTEDTTVSDFVAAIELNPGVTVECTFTNTQRGMIRVDKETLPDEYDFDFDFTFAGGEEDVPFTLNDATDDEEDPWSSGLIPPGSYQVSETVPEGWALTDADCGVLGETTATVALEPGAVVTCTFTNTAELGTTTVTKTVSGFDDGGDTWTFDFELNGDVVSVDQDNPTVTWTDLEVGETYTLLEINVPAGWTAGVPVCDVPDADPETGGHQVVITPGFEMECTVENVQSAPPRPPEPGDEEEADQVPPEPPAATLPAAGSEVAPWMVLTGLGLLVAGGLLMLARGRRRLG